MDVKEVIEYNEKAMRDHLSIEVLSGNVAKQEFYKGAIYAFSALLAHPVLAELPATPSNSAMVPCLCRCGAVAKHHLCPECFERAVGFM